MNGLRITIESADKTAVALRRGAVPPNPSDWGRMVAEAQRVIGEFQEQFHTNAALLDEAHALPLIGAARILTSTAEAPQLALSDASRAELLLMSGAAHAMYGNGPAAFVSTQRAVSLLEGITPSLAVGIATLAPRLLGSVGPLAAGFNPQADYFEWLNYFIATGDEQSETQLDDALHRTMLDASGAFEGALLRCARLALAQLRTLSSSRVLRAYADLLPGGYIQRLIDTGHPTLLPPQYRAIALAGFLRTNDNSIVSLPTSTGKTLLAELALLVSLRCQNGLAVYIAPYVALGGQVLSVLRSRLGDDVQVFPQLGGYAVEGTPAPDINPTILVATPEGFDSLLRQRPALLDALRCVVVDEAHMLESGTRGLRLEGLITRLRLRQIRGQPLRLVLLSAVLGSVANLTAWLNVGRQALIREEWRPTARRLAVWTEAGRLSWLQADDPVVPAGARPSTVVWLQDLPWPQHIRTPADRVQDAVMQQPAVNQNVAYMADYLHRLFGGPVLCVCGTKRTSREIAAAVADRLQDLEPIPSDILAIISSIDTTHLHLRPAIPYLRRGVAFHNASVPHDVRRLIETAARNRQLRVVAATTTLAEGVDLPFRATIVERWLIGFGAKQRPMSPLTFRNIAGRCGRAGTYTEGDTVLFDNPVGSLHFAHPRTRREHQLFLLLPPAQLGSAAHATEPDVSAAIVGAQLLAAIAENETIDNVPDHFARASYAAQTGDYGQLSAAITTTLRDIESDPPLARAASPFRLTPLGAAVNQTGLSPRTARHLLRVLERLDPQDAMEVIGGRLLDEFASAPEQNSELLRKTVHQRNSRVPVKPADFEAVIRARGLRIPLITSFSQLSVVRRSKKQVPFERWAAGELQSATWDQDFDKYVEFVNAAIDNFLPWLFRASAILSAAAELRVEQLDWPTWSHEMLAHEASETRLDDMEPQED